MDKLSKSQVAEVLAAVGPALLKLASERDAAFEELQAYRRQIDAEKVASAMIQKGITTEPYDRVVEQMVKAAEKGELERIRDAIDLSGPDMGEKVARIVSDDEPQASASSGSDFERFILGGIG
jgi:hypothetical protein